MINLLATKGVIFDLDGTLVESALDFSQIKQQLGCPVKFDLLDFVADLPTQQQQEHANNIILEHETHDAINAKALPNMHTLLATIAQLKLPAAIVTRNSKAATATKLQQNNIKMDVVLTRECYPAKPAPDALLAIAAMWDIDPRSLIYVGDYLYDIQAAKNAGMTSVFINHNKHHEYESQADVVVNNLQQLQQAIWDANR